MQLITIKNGAINDEFNLFAPVTGDPETDLDTLRSLGVDVECFEAYDRNGNWITSSEL